MKKQFHRLYRPAYFQEVVGQDSHVKNIINHLKHAACPQAILFSGESGVGKTTLARLIAKYLNCENPNTEKIEPCNECSSCKDIVNENWLRDTYMIDCSSKRGVSQIDALKEDITSYPMHGKNKIFIFDEAHMLTQQAFNAFLTVLEEPPEFVFFFFCTTQKRKIMNTIRTRCIHFELNSIKDKDIAKGLFVILKKNNVQINRSIMATLNKIAGISFGSLREAINYLQQLYYNDALSLEKSAEYLPEFSQTTLGKCISWLFNKDPQILQYIDTLGKMKDMDAFFLQMKAVIKNTVLVKCGATPNVSQWIIDQATINSNKITNAELIYLSETFNLDITRFYNPKDIFFARIASFILGEHRNIDETNR